MDKKQMEGRIFAFGDIHGCADQLLRLLTIIPTKGPEDRLVFLGDYIDRGPDSRSVIEILIKLKAQYPNTVFLMGNHEQMLLDYLSGRNRELYFLNGGEATLASYGVSIRKYAREFIPVDHLNFFQELQLYFETQDYIFVHAGLRPGFQLADQSAEDILWIREEFYLSNFRFDKTIVFAHTPFREPFVLADRIGIDTGVVYGQKLTCLELPSLRFYQA